MPENPSPSGTEDVSSGLFPRIWRTVTYVCVVAKDGGIIPACFRPDERLGVFMNDLLAFAVAAHGGLDLWHRFSNLRAEVSIDRAIFRIKPQPGSLIDKVLEIRTHEPWLTIPRFPMPNRRSRSAPGRIVVETTVGEVIEARDNFGTVRLPGQL